jgi:hypothetical protein
MITRTGLQLLTDSLKLIGVVAGHEVPTSAEQTDAFARLNELIDSWGTQAQTLIVSRRDPVTLHSGQQTYSFGAGGDLGALPRPMAIDHATVLVGGSPAVEIPVAVLTAQEYEAIAIKSLTGAQVTAVLFAPTTTSAELWVWPVPTGAQTLVLYYDEPVAQFPDLTTPISLAPGYAKAIRTNLAVELAPEFGRVVDPLIDRLARESLADIKRVNVPLTEISLSGVPGVGGGSYDIVSDS